MADLTVTITQVTEEDYDGVDETVKIATGVLGTATLPETLSCTPEHSDADVTTDYKTFLTSLGYTWDN